MDEILNKLLSSKWGRSYIGFPVIVLLCVIAGLGWAYYDLLKDYQEAEVRHKKDIQDYAAANERCWEERLADMRALHARQDSIIYKIRKK